MERMIKRVGAVLNIFGLMFLISWALSQRHLSDEK